MVFSEGSRSGTTLRASSVETAEAVSTVVSRLPGWTAEPDHNRWPVSYVKVQHRIPGGNPQAKKDMEFIRPGR